MMEQAGPHDHGHQGLHRIQAPGLQDLEGLWFVCTLNPKQSPYIIPI